jgi:hypothetical protein
MDPTFFGLAGRRSADVQPRYIQDAGESACCDPVRHVVFSAGRQQRNPQVHFKGVVVKTPSKIRGPFEFLSLRYCALSADISERIWIRPCRRSVKVQWS